jgi:hypothetical protein
MCLVGLYHRISTNVNEKDPKFLESNYFQSPKVHDKKLTFCKCFV